MRVWSVRFTDSPGIQAYLYGPRATEFFKLLAKWAMSQRDKTNVEGPAEHLQDQMRTKFRVPQS